MRSITKSTINADYALQSYKHNKDKLQSNDLEKKQFKDMLEVKEAARKVEESFISQQLGILFEEIKFNQFGEDDISDDIYKSMLKDAISEKISSTSTFGIADMITKTKLVK